MGQMYFNGYGIVSGLPTSKAAPLGGGLQATLRLATDVLFYTTVTLQNVQPGSNYWIASSANLAVTLASGTQGATSADIVISSIPALTNGQLITIRVRNYGTTKYQPYETQAALIRSGTLAYIVQTLDTIGA